MRALLAALTLALAAPAAAQPGDAALARQQFEALLSEGAAVARRTEGSGPVSIVASAVRASDHPGVCEFDVLELAARPPWAAADSPAVRAVSAERHFALVAVEPQATFDPAVFARRDRACREFADGRRFPDGFFTAQRGELVWLAGQLLSQVRGSLPCRARTGCPTPAERAELFQPPALRGVGERETCPDDICLWVTLTIREPDLRIWRGELRGKRLKDYGVWRLTHVSVEPSAVILMD